MKSYLDEERKLLMKIKASKKRERRYLGCLIVLFIIIYLIILNFIISNIEKL